MIQIDNTIVSFDVFDDCFACDLTACHGACCIEGDGGAPLEEAEISALANHLEQLLPFMDPDGREAVQQQGVFTVDTDGEYVTALVEKPGGNRGACVFACTEDGTRLCAIERAEKAGAVSFSKPLSCHLYPIRITEYKDFDAVNVHHWDICRSACELGCRLQLPLYKFLKAPLTRKYGAEWYEKLCIAAGYARQRDRR